MNLASKRVIKSLLKKNKIYPSKQLGQTFLIDKKVTKKVIKTAELRSENVVLEIGPGPGVLTQEIAKRVKKVIAVEKDRKIVEILKEQLKAFENVKIIQGDILRLNFLPLLAGFKNYKVIANLPFYITAPAIRIFLESKTPPKEMVLIVQKEVAQRICAEPPKMNLLAVSVQFYSKPKIIGYISKKSFWPTPKVDSAIIKVIPRASVHNTISFRKQFFKIVKTGFSHPRKQLANNLLNGLALSLLNGVKLNKGQINSWLEKNNIQPTQRAEALTIKGWIKLTKTAKII